MEPSCGDLPNPKNIEGCSNDIPCNTKNAIFVLNILLGLNLRTHQLYDQSLPVFS